MKNWKNNHDYEGYIMETVIIIIIIIIIITAFV